MDNDCDGNIDEEVTDGIDNDGDGFVDEDVQVVRVMFGIEKFMINLFT